jgi:hypothetical protein
MTSPHDERRMMPLSPRELLISRLPAVLALWEHGPSPETARDLLALWAGLRRLDRAAPDPDEDRLDALARADASRLVRQASAKPLLDADDWLRRAGELDRAWDQGEADPQELDWQAHQLFQDLDRASLAAWAMSRLTLPDVDAARSPDGSQALVRAEEFLTARVDLFVCLASDAAAVLSSARPGLEDDETELWETLLKHRRIEEARDQLEAPLDRAAALAAARQPASAIQPSRAEPVGVASHGHDNDWSFLPETPLAMAANVPRPTVVVHLHWREPGGPHHATLAVDRADVETPLRINFYRGGEQATEMRETAVWLAECEGEIDQDGNADFPQDCLRRARAEGRAVTLRVGGERKAWERIEQTLP